MIQINNEFTIQADPSEVWNVIAQTDKYSDWNSFVSECESSLIVGEPIEMRVHILPFAITQKETILEHEPGVILSYGVNLPLNLIKSERKHTITILESGHVRYRSQFYIDGLFAPLVQILLASKLSEGFSNMTKEMHAEVLRRQK
jgi:hypothetical protein